MNEIIVGNIGTVYSGNKLREAMQHYSEYVKQSKGTFGRASGENVTWMVNGEIYREHIGWLESDPSLGLL